MKIICINVSDIAVISGHNKYRSLKTYKPQISIEEFYRPNLIKWKTDKKESTLSISKSLIDDVSNIEISEEDLSKILEEESEKVKEEASIIRGQLKESSNLDKSEDILNIKISHRNTKIYSRVLFANSKILIEIRGKIDGISGQTIIETKNRRKKLFGSIPDYEMVQLEGYMFITGMDKCIHAECFNGNINHSPYKHDKTLWDECTKKIIEYVTKTYTDDNLIVESGENHNAPDNKLGKPEQTCVIDKYDGSEEQDEVFLYCGYKTIFGLMLIFFLCQIPIFIAHIKYNDYEL